MPRKKRVIIDSEIPDSVIETGDGEPVSIEEGLDDNYFDSFGEEPFLIKVYKITPTGSSFAFSTTEKPTATFDSLVQDRCPSGGKFAIRRYINNRIVEPTRHIEVEPKPTPVTANAAESVYSVQVKMLTDQLMMMQNMVMAFIGRPTPVTQQTPVTELASLMTTMHQLQPPKTDSVDMLIKGMELAKGLNGSGEGDWKSTLISSAKEVLSPVASIIASHKMQNGNGIPNPPVQQISEVSMQGEDFLIKQGLVWLKGKIISGLPVEEAVNWIYMNGNDPMYRPFITKALGGDINTFIAVDPELANEPYRSWLTNAINMMKEIYASNNQADNDGGDRNDTDSTGNENVSARVPTIQKVG